MTATFTGTARRAQIVEAAIETIADLGYARASFAQIARRAGLSSTGLISYHFAGKADLLERVVAEVADGRRAYMLPRVDAADDSRARLRAYIESNLEYLATHRARMIAAIEIFNAMPRGREGRPAAYLADYEEVVAELERALEDGQRSGELRPFSPRVMAVTIRAAIAAAAYRFASDPDVDTLAHARELADLFDRAVAPAN